MSGTLHNALDIGVQGLAANSHAISIISENVANINTVGYKQRSSEFKTVFYAEANKVGSFGTGGVTNRPLQNIDTQGVMRVSDNPTDLSLAGDGFFAVSLQETPSEPADYAFTRAGQFRLDKDGNLVNTAGHYLLGWQYDIDNQTLPGTDETRQTDFSLLSNINMSNFSGDATATQNIDFKINLDASQASQSNARIYEAGRTFDSRTLTVSDPTFSATSTNTISSSSFVNEPINIGDTLTITGTTSNDGTYTVSDFDTTTGLVTVTEPVVDEAYSGDLTATHVNPTPAAQGVSASGAAGATFTTSPAQMVATDLIGADINVGDYLVVRSVSATANDGAYLVDAFDSTTGTVTFASAPASAGTVTSATFDILEDDNPAFYQDELANSVGDASFTAGGSSFQSSALANGPFKAGDLVDIGTTSGTNDGIWVIESYNSIFGQMSLRSRDGSQTMVTEELSDSDITLFRHIPNYTGIGSVTDNSLTPTQVNQMTTMANGDLVPDFQRAISIYDGQGVEHGLNVSFVKSETPNTWYVELSSLDAYRGETTDDPDYHVDGLIGFGTVKFNTDGSLAQSASNMYVADFTDGGTPPITYNRVGLADAGNYEVIWDPDTTGASGSTTTGLLVQTIETIDFGTDGKTDGIFQNASDSLMYSYDIDGAEFGRFTTASVDEDGWVYANFSNGEQTKAYKLALGDVPNTSFLQALTGNAYQATDESGEFTLGEARNTIEASVNAYFLEQSTVDLSEQFTDMIIMQRAYSAVAKLLTTADEMLQEAARFKG